MLSDNPSFDIQTEVSTGRALLNKSCLELSTDPGVILGCYPLVRATSLEMRQSLESGFENCAPPPEQYYFGIVLTGTKVAGIFKSSNAFDISAWDVHLLSGFVRKHESSLLKKAPCFFSLCIPSISPNYKMQVFYHTSARKTKEYGLRYLVVCEEATEETMNIFERSFKSLVQNMLYEANLEKLQQ